MQFTPKTPVRDLWGTFIDAKPRDYDFWEHSIGTDWNCWEATECEKCGAALLQGGDEHDNLDYNSDCEGYVYETEGPMMNYTYPVSVNRVGGVGGVEAAARALVNLPLCIVEIDGEHYMALTGGGMDLSWEICEGYMRLGYLPPTHFYDLPQMAGKRLNTRNKWILAGMRRGLLVEKKQTTWALRKLKNLRARMGEVGK